MAGEKPIIAVITPPQSGGSVRVTPPTVVHALVDAPPLITARISVDQGPSGPPGPRGLQGEQGVPGAARFHVHTQDEPAAQWIITHNLGKFPYPTVIDDEGDVVDPGVHYDSQDQMTLRFSRPFVGRAYCN